MIFKLKLSSEERDALLVLLHAAIKHPETNAETCDVAFSFRQKILKLKPVLEKRKNDDDVL